MTISCIKSVNGRKYLEYKGRPRLLYGIQIRLDDAARAGLPESEGEDYFRRAAACCFPMVCIPVSWRYAIEPDMTEGRDCGFLRRCIGWADKYGLELQWLWFGSNVCGVASGVPEDMYHDPETYPRYPYEKEMLFDIAKPAFLGREKKAFDWFLSMLAKLDVHCRTTGIQIENEPDFWSWRGQRTERMRTIDRLGTAVKEGPYRVMTRVNITAPRKYLGEDPLIDELLALPGVDAVGVDVYINETAYCTDFMEHMRRSPKNLPHFAEMGAHVAELPAFICDTLQRGGGALLYELRTVGNRDYDFGLFRRLDHEWEERDGTKPVQYQWTEGEFTGESRTADIVALNKMIAVAEEALATSAVEDIAMIPQGGAAHPGGRRVVFDAEGDPARSPEGFGMAVAAPDGFLYLFTLAQGGRFRADGLPEYRLERHTPRGWEPLELSADGHILTPRGEVLRLKLR